MTIKILGTGCPNCQTLERHTHQALTRGDIDATVEKVEDMPEIMSYGVMSTPALVVDEEVRVTGRVPTVKEITDLLSG